MNKRKSKYLVLGMVLLTLLVATACGGSAQEVAQPTLEPMIMVTQYVTQVVATRIPTTPAPVATSTLAAAPRSAGWDPLAQPIYYPIMDCVASRLHIGDRAFVAFVNDLVGIYQSKDIEDAPLFRKPNAGEELEILDGPWCRNGALVWQTLAKADELVGFTPEGNGQQYWLLPLQPYTPTPDK